MCLGKRLIQCIKEKPNKGKRNMIYKNTVLTPLKNELKIGAQDYVKMFAEPVLSEDQDLVSLSQPLVFLYSSRGLFLKRIRKSIWWKPLKCLNNKYKNGAEALFFLIKFLQEKML